MAGSARFWLALLWAVLLLQLALTLPILLKWIRPEAFLRLPLELPALLAAVLLIRSAALRWAIAAGALAIVLLRLSDMASFAAFSQPFDLVHDWPLVRAAFELLGETIGRPGAVAVTLAALALLLAAAWSLGAALARLARGPRPARLGLAAVALAVLAAGAGLSVVERQTGRDLRVQAALGGEVARRAEAVRNRLVDGARFADAIADDPLSGAARPDFAALRGLDVGVIWVESYGRAAFDRPAAAEVVGSRLAEMEADLDAAGLAAMSGWLAAPTRGGQSWLSHATFMSGLTVDRHGRYAQLTGSGRAALTRLFGQAGWRTAVVSPAIVRAWPAAEWYGADKVLVAADLGYRGLPFDWVTIPDQFTLDAFQRQVRPGPPLMADIMLISSHAPWTPRPDLVSWGNLGDGRIFDGSRRQGGSSAEVWADPDRSRAAYAAALDYSLSAVSQYLERHGAGGFWIVLGDHQPWPRVAGDGAPPDVPIHVISDDPALLARLPADRFSPGLVPAEGAHAPPMAEMRGLLARLYSTRPDAAGPPPSGS